MGGTGQALTRAGRRALPASAAIALLMLAVKTMRWRDVASPVTEAASRLGLREYVQILGWSLDGYVSDRLNHVMK
jgi:hypothetical protein